jgi:hypothetical protein
VKTGGQTWTGGNLAQGINLRLAKFFEWFWGAGFKKNKKKVKKGIDTDKNMYYFMMLSV